MAKNTIKTVQERIAELRAKYPQELEPLGRWWTQPGRRAMQFLGEKMHETRIPFMMSIPSPYLRKSRKWRHHYKIYSDQ